MAEDFSFDDFAESLASGVEGVKVEGPRRKTKKVKPESSSEDDSIFDIKELETSLGETFDFCGDLANRAWGTDSLTPEEKERLARAWAPVIDKYLHEWLVKNSIWIPVLLVTPPIVGKRALQGYANTHKPTAEDGDAGITVMDPDDF